MRYFIVIIPFLFLSCGIVGLDYDATVKEEYRCITNSPIVITNVETDATFIKIKCIYVYESAICRYTFSYSDCKLVNDTNWMRLIESENIKRLKRVAKQSL